jgi:hypothetical protein
VFIYYRTGSYVPAFRQNRADERLRVASHRDLNELLAEGLIAQTLDLGPEDREFGIQIVFEGTVRIVRSGRESSVPVTFSPGKNILGRGFAPMVVPEPMVKPLRLRTPRNARPERRSFNRVRTAGRVED